jgi:hypothetical protein
MRIRVIQKPTCECIDGISLRPFEVGRSYEMDALLAAVFLAEQWAVPVTDNSPEPPHTTRVEQIERRKKSLLPI